LQFGDGCIQFQGTTNNNYAVLSSVDFDDFANTGFTIAIWYKYTSGSSAIGPTLFDFGKNTESHISLAKPSSSTRLTVTMRENSTSTTALDLGSGSLLRDSWKHIAIVVSAKSATGGKATVSAYLDGVLLLQSAANSMPFPVGVMSRMWLGRALTTVSGTSSFSGYIDSFSILYSAATIDTVKTMMDSFNNLVIIFLFLYF
jgi:hypothetical protein